ncbi:hypothetical protein AB0L06_30685 [Spirillospora sp. NPDC052269]
MATAHVGAVTRPAATTDAHAGDRPSAAWASRAPPRARQQLDAATLPGGRCPTAARTKPSNPLRHAAPAVTPGGQVLVLYIACGCLCSACE